MERFEIELSVNERAALVCREEFRNNRWYCYAAFYVPVEFLSTQGYDGLRYLYNSKYAPGAKVKYC